jgi:hypothetical protein
VRAERGDVAALRREDLIPFGRKVFEVNCDGLDKSFVKFEVS